MNRWGKFRSHEGFTLVFLAHALSIDVLLLQLTRNYFWYQSTRSWSLLYLFSIQQRSHWSEATDTNTESSFKRLWLKYTTVTVHKPKRNQNETKPTGSWVDIICYWLCLWLKWCYKNFIYLKRPNYVSVVYRYLKKKLKSRNKNTRRWLKPRIFSLKVVWVD